jgi:hypothetical protein
MQQHVAVFGPAKPCSSSCRIKPVVNTWSVPSADAGAPRRCQPTSSKALATGNRLQCGFTAAECCQAPGALTLHQGPQGLLEQGAAFLIPAQLLAPGQQASLSVTVVRLAQPWACLSVDIARCRIRRAELQLTPSGNSRHGQHDHRPRSDRGAGADPGALRARACDTPGVDPSCSPCATTKSARNGWPACSRRLRAVRAVASSAS